MFERTPSPHADHPPFLDWLRQHDNGEWRTEAHRMLTGAAERIPEVQRYVVTPQGAPWHVEGPMVSDHIERILFALFVVQHEDGLPHVEEFAREKDLVLEVEALQTTIRAHGAFLAAFALVHDVTKPDLLTFDAQPETKGAAEGFSGNRRPTAPELVRYDKLLRAFAAAHPHTKSAQLLVAFFDAYGIETHYDDHAPRAASKEYAAFREAVMHEVGLPLSYARLLTEIIRYHIDVLSDVDATKYRVIAARAGKAGLNVDLVLDLTLAHVFLDAVAGSVTSSGAQTALLIRHMRAEREAFPERHAARELAQLRAAKQAQKDVFAACGLDESLFTLLGTPYGPERGDVMRRIREALADPAANADFGPHTAEVARRLAACRARLSQPPAA